MRLLLFKTFLAITCLLLAISARDSTYAQSGIINADFDFKGFYAAGDGTSGAWIPFWIGTKPTIWKSTAEGSRDDGPPSLLIYADARTFDAGVYQVVPVTPGHGYHFQVNWAVVRQGGSALTDNVQLVRTIGIDPFGGIDPLSPNVRWSAECYGSGKWPPELAIDEFARNTKITIFIRAQNRYTNSRNEVFFDHAVLTDNGQTTQVTLPTNTPAVAPRTSPPTKAPPTATRSTKVAVVPTSTHTPEPTPTLTPLPSPSPTTASTSTPIATRTPRATPTPEPAVSNLDPSDSPALLILGMIACVIGAVGLVVLAGVAYWYLSRR